MIKEQQEDSKADYSLSHQLMEKLEDHFPINFSMFFFFFFFEAFHVIFNLFCSSYLGPEERIWRDSPSQSYAKFMLESQN